MCSYVTIIEDQVTDVLTNAVLPKSVEVKWKR